MFMMYRCKKLHRMVFSLLLSKWKLNVLVEFGRLLWWQEIKQHEGGHDYVTNMSRQNVLHETVIRIFVRETPERRTTRENKRLMILEHIGPSE